MFHFYIIYIYLSVFLILCFGTDKNVPNMKNNKFQHCKKETTNGIVKKNKIEAGK